MDFLLDYTLYVEKNKVPVFNTEKIYHATTLENATDPLINELFMKHFDYNFMRSDMAVIKYLNIFGHFLECSSAIVSEQLITLFAIAHKIIIQHLPSAEFIVDE